MSWISENIDVLATIVSLTGTAVFGIIKYAQLTKYKTIISEKNAEIARLREERKEDCSHYDKQIEKLLNKYQDIINNLNIK